MENPVRDKPPPDLKVIETLRWDPERGFIRLAWHLSRCAETCKQFGIPFDAEAVRAALHRPASGEHMRVRLTIDLNGHIAVSATEISGAPPDVPWRIALSDDRLRADDPWLRVKTTNRELYDRARRDLPAHLDEIIFANERGEICEGTITNLFFDFGDGLITPPLSCGLLPGVLRAELLASGECREGVVTITDLDRAEAIWAGNSVRGLIRCELICQGDWLIASAGQ